MSAARQSAKREASGRKPAAALERSRGSARNAALFRMRDGSGGTGEASSFLVDVREAVAAVAPEPPSLGLAARAASPTFLSSFSISSFHSGRQEASPLTEPRAFFAASSSADDRSSWTFPVPARYRSSRAFSQSPARRDTRAEAGVP